MIVADGDRNRVSWGNEGGFHRDNGRRIGPIEDISCALIPDPIGDVVGISIVMGLGIIITLLPARKHHPVSGPFPGCVLHGDVMEIGPPEFDKATK